MLFVGSRAPGMSAYTRNPITGSPLSSSLCQQQPLNKLMHSKGCSLVLSTSLLAIGITITVMSLQSFSSANKIFLIGPILMTVGILGLSRALMQYIKKLDNRRRRLESRERARARRSRQVVQGALPQPPVTRCGVPSGHGRVQREDSEEPIYIGPTDSEDNGYPDDPPPYDAITSTGRTVASHVQRVNHPRASLTSLPPYEEGLVNPGLDLSTEAFPSPPPYEIVAVQPPTYTPSVPTEGTERPVYGLLHTTRRPKGRGSLPTSSTVQEVADRLLETLQSEGRGESSSSQNDVNHVTCGQESQSTDIGEPGESSTVVESTVVTLMESGGGGDTRPETAESQSQAGIEDCHSNLCNSTPEASTSNSSTIQQSEHQAGECHVTLDIETSGDSQTDMPYVSTTQGNNNETETKSETGSDLESDIVDSYLNNNQGPTHTTPSGTVLANDQFEKHLSIAVPLADPLN